MKCTFASVCALAVSAFAVNASGQATSINLNNYARIGRFALPDPSVVAAPPNNLLAQEASGVAYNPDTDSLFIIGDGGRSITQVSKTGALINTMTLAPGSSPQGTDFYDPEGITYVGNNQFVFTEERDRNAVRVTYAAGTTIGRANAQIVKLGTSIGNVGLEGLTYDPYSGGYVFAKEISPQGIFQTTIDFAAGTASNGSAATINSTNLFDPALLGLGDIADVYSLSLIPSFSGQPDEGNLLVLSQESAKVLEVSRSGVILSSLTITGDLGDTLSMADMQHEGLTMDNNGYLYIVNENGGGDINHPQLWVYAPVPEPTSALLAASGLAGLLMRRRRPTAA